MAQIAYLIYHKRKLAFYFKLNRTEKNRDNLNAEKIERAFAISESIQSQWIEFINNI